MRIRTRFSVAITGLLWLVPEASAGAGPVDQLQDSLPSGAIGQLGSPRLPCGIDCMAFSPDGKYVAAGGATEFGESSIGLWECATGKLVRRFGGQHGTYWALAFTPDSSILISGGDGLGYWDVHKGTMLKWTRTHVYALAISPDGKTCAGGTSQGGTGAAHAYIHLWRQNGQGLIGSIASPTEVDFVAFSPDGRWLVSTGAELRSNRVCFWDVGTRKRVWQLPDQAVGDFWRNSVAFSSDGCLFAVAAGQGEIQIWHTGQRKKVRTLTGSTNGTRSRVLGFAAKDSRLFTLSHEGQMQIWDLENGKLLEHAKERFGLWRGHFSWIVALSPDASTIAYSDGKAVKFWDVKTQKQRLRTPGHDWTIRSIDFAPDGRTLASCADDHTVCLWDVERRDELRQWATGPNNHAWQLRYSKDGKTVITANYEYVELRDPSTGGLIATLGDTKSSGLIEARMLPDQKTVVSVDDRQVRLWNVEQKQVIRAYPAPEGILRSAISPDGHFVALFGRKGIAILDTSNGKLHATRDDSEPETLVFSPDGRYLAWQSSDGVAVWDMSRMHIHRRMRTRVGPRALAFDRTSRYLVAAGSDPKIRIWDVKNGNPVGAFTRAGGEIYCLAFSPTEDLLASAGDDCTVTLWDLHKKTLPPTPSTDEMLRKLLAAYRLYGLPTPPADARLVRFDPGKEGHSLGLLVRPAQGKDKGAVFWHPEKYFVDRREAERKFQLIEPAPAVLRDDVSLWDDNLSAAIHCKALGWDALAKAVFESTEPVFVESAEEDLAGSAWFHWWGKLRDPDANWPEIARRLRTIVNDRPKDFGAYPNQLRSLERALVPSKAKPGSLEAMVDDLIEVRSDPNGFSKGADRRYQKLALRGFEAVPTLIEHLDDERLTRMYREAFNNFRGYHYRICDFATDILQELAGNDLGAWRLRGDLLDKPTAQAWWDEAKKAGEEAYFLSHVLGNKESVRPNSLMLAIISQKNPKNLPQVYRQMLAGRPKMTGLPVLQAISSSSLPAEEIRKLLVLGAKHENPRHRGEALKFLKKLEPK